MNRGTRNLLALMSVLVLLLTACGDPEPETDGGVDLGLIAAGELRVGSDINFAPFEFVEDGVEKGFDVDLLNAMAERVGLNVTYVNTSFDTIFTQLANNEFDAIISAITITAERDETIDFTEPYFQANQALVAGVDSGINSVADLAGKDVGAQAGTTGLDYANENFTDAKVVEFPDAPVGFTALGAGQIDAFFIDIPVAADEVARNSDLKLVEEVETNELYGIGVSEGNEALRDALNDALAALIADGTYATLFEKWFPGTPLPARFAATEPASADDASASGVELDADATVDIGE